VLSTARPPCVIHTAAPDRGKLVTLIAGSKNSRLLFAGDGRRRVYDEKPQCYDEDNRTTFNDRATRICMGALKMQDQKTQDLKTQDQMSGVKMQDLKMQDEMFVITVIHAAGVRALCCG